MAKTLYIIGNGFDRYHELDTRYQSFAFYLQNNHSSIYDLLIQYFGLPDLDPDDDNSYHDPLWADFESALAGLDFETVLEDNTDYLANPGSPDFRDRDWHTYQIEMEMIVDKLTKDLRKAFKEFIMEVEFPEPVETKLLDLEVGSVFLNFNYTDTLERYYYIHWKRILYIHGKAKLPEDGIILGHGHDPNDFKEQEVKEPEGLDEEQLERWRDEMSDQYDYSYESGKSELMSYFNNSFKSTEEVIEKWKSFFDNLNGIEKIVVLGHSISSVDQPYFIKLIECIQKQTVHWKVSYYSDAERDSHSAKLVSLGLKEEQIEMIKMNTLIRQWPSLF